MTEAQMRLLRKHCGRNTGLKQRTAQPSAVILDSCPLQSTPESEVRASYNDAKRRKGSKAHAAIDPWGTCWRFT